MLGGMLVAMTLSMSPGQCTTCGPSPMEFSPGVSAGSWSAGGGGMYPTYDAVSAGGGGGGDQLYPYDSPEPWLHGYFQEIPAYGGFGTYRPHNYKHVLAQMQMAGGWGINPAMAYSHQWYHRYRQRSGMHPNFGTQQGTASAVSPSFQNMAQNQLQPTMMGNAVANNLQQASAFQRGYTDPAIPGISTPYYQVPASTISTSGTAGRMVNEEQLEALQKLQQQLEQQTFQLQTMQQQLDMANARRVHNQQPWAQPNHQQFVDQNSGVQDLPGPSAQVGFPGQGQQMQPPIVAQPATSTPGLLNSAIGQQFNPAMNSMSPAANTGVPQQQLIPQQQYPQQLIPQTQGYEQPYQGQMIQNGFVPNNNPQPMMQMPSQAYFSTQQTTPEMNQVYANSPAMYQQQYPAVGQQAQAFQQQAMPQQITQPQQFVPYSNGMNQMPAMGQQFQQPQQYQSPQQFQQPQQAFVGQQQFFQ